MQYLAFIAVLAVMGYLMYRQQITIDNLTNKLMAKDYSEYKRGNNITITDEKPTRKPLSYYDDPSIPLDED